LIGFLTGLSAVSGSEDAGVYNLLLALHEAILHVGWLLRVALAGSNLDSNRSKT
jgi:hypothetical protein